MKVAPVSGDLLVKLALVAAALGVAWWAVRRTAAALPDMPGMPNIVPWDDGNVAYAGVNRIGGAMVTDPAGPGKNADGSWTLGGWIYDVTH